MDALESCLHQQSKWEQILKILLEDFQDQRGSYKGNTEFQKPQAAFAEGGNYQVKKREALFSLCNSA